MTGHLPSTSSEYRREYGPPVQAIVVVFIALLILSLWMGFVLAQQIESTGRDIQEKTEELRALERRRDTLLREIAVTGSQQRMSDQAWAMGYRPQTPIYLRLSQPLAQATPEVAARGGPVATTASADEQTAGPSASLWELLTQQAQGVEQETAP